MIPTDVVLAFARHFARCLTMANDSQFTGLWASGASLLDVQQGGEPLPVLVIIAMGPETVDQAKAFMKSAQPGPGGSLRIMESDGRGV